MKKFLTLFLTLFVASSVWAYDFVYNGIYYNYVSQTENTVAVTYSKDYKTYSGNVTIQSSVTYRGKTYSVTSIGESAFYGCTGLTSVTILEGVISIGKSAFYGCTGLTSITIPNSVTSIGFYAFDGCTGVTSVTTNSNADFAGALLCFIKDGIKYHVLNKNIVSVIATSYSGNVVIPKTVTAGSTFSVTSIRESAFSNCTGLTSVTIPNSVTSIGESAFSNCTGLTSVTIPNSVTSIGRGAFSGCTGLTSITIPNSVTSIGEGTFFECTGLTSITIPNSVTSIGNAAFNGCTGLTSLTILEGVTSIGVGAFYGCRGLTSVTIPNSVTFLAGFGNCTGLMSITIPESVTSIGEYAFYNCTGLTSLTIPNSVTSIGEDAFKSCNRIIYAGSATGWPWGAPKVYGAMDDNFLYSDVEKMRLAEYIGESNDVVIPNSVTYIGKYVFGERITSVTIPESVTSIEQYAFSGCSNLTSIIIPNNVKTISSYTFNNCSKLKKVTIGANCNTIWENAFKGCTRLIDIICYAEDVPTAKSTSFENYNGYLYVPCEYLRYYKADNIFGQFANIECIQSEETVLQKDDVEIVPEISNALFSMPKNESANSYTLTIQNNGVTFCTLTFNENGQLSNIDFSTNKSYELKAGVSAFQFTVTGLSTAADYGYSFKALASNKSVLKEYTGSFTTKNADGTGGSSSSDNGGQGGGSGEGGQGGQGGSTAINGVSNATTVAIVNNQILVNGEAPAFVVTISGKKIANQNLKSGVYFVVVDGETVKVSVQ